MLEAIVRVRRDAFDEQQLGVREPVERGAQRRLVQPRHRLQQRMREAAPEHRADLRDLARGAEPVETGGERLLQRRRDRLHAALFAALEQQPRHFLDEQRHAAAAFGDARDHVLRQARGASRSRRPCARPRPRRAARARSRRDASAASRAGGIRAASSR